MALFKHIGDRIQIDEVELPITLFKVLEPEYRPHPDLEILIYKDGVLTTRLKGKTSTFGGGAWKEGDRYIARKQDFVNLLKTVNQEDGQINITVESIKEPKQCREREYPTIRELVVALWEHVVEGRDRESSGVNALQSRRLSVKNKYPLKENTNASNPITPESEGLLLQGPRRTRHRNKHSG